MILKYTNTEGLEWLIKAPYDTVEEARASVEVSRGPDVPSMVDSNGSGPWTFSEVEHEAAFPHEREPQRIYEGGVE